MKDLFELGLIFEPKNFSQFDKNYLKGKQIVQIEEAIQRGTKRYCLICEDYISIHKNEKNYLRKIKQEFEFYEYSQIQILDLFS